MRTYFVHVNTIERQSSSQNLCGCTRRYVVAFLLAPSLREVKWKGIKNNEKLEEKHTSLHGKTLNKGIKEWNSFKQSRLLVSIFIFNIKIVSNVNATSSPLPPPPFTTASYVYLYSFLQKLVSFAFPFMFLLFFSLFGL